VFEGKEGFSRLLRPSHISTPPNQPNRPTKPPARQAWGFSRELSFRAAPEEGPDTTVKFLAVADLGQAEADGSMEQNYYTASLNTTRRLNAEGDSYQLLLHNGGESSDTYLYSRSWTPHLLIITCTPPSSPSSPSSLITQLHHQTSPTPAAT
jgi:hypothetical protein